ncbi:sister chromatid cohesion protein Dcc1 [Helicostylum pulchrum]|nr:sister chromatid cohesion protein Dcc1 [Helicostylum pulchrum]
METKLVYKQDFEKNAYRLVELSSPELLEAFESGDCIVIKGLAEDEAVLCTASKTFVVRQVNTSNSIVLIDSEANEGRHLVQDDLSNTIELLPCLARLGRLDELLKDSTFSGLENEATIKESKTMYTLQDLLSIVQASRQELLQGLKERGAFEYEGYYRLFDKDYLLELVDFLLTNLLIHGMDIQHMSLNQAKECIREGSQEERVDIPDDLLVAMLSLFCDVADNGEIQFDRRKICRFLGEWILFNPKNKRWEVPDFLKLWSTMGHELFKPELKDIEGLYIIRETTKFQRAIQYIQYFSIQELSTDPAQRFATLFSEKPLWKLEEIQMFLTDLAPTKKQLELLLLKFARSHRQQNTVLYGSRIK